MKEEISQKIRLIIALMWVWRIIMKKVDVFLFLGIIFVSFILLYMLSQGSLAKAQKPITYQGVEGSDIYVIKIDECEYLAYSIFGQHYGYTHKGNCNNPLHKENENLNKGEK